MSTAASGSPECSEAGRGEQSEDKWKKLMKGERAERRETEENDEALEEEFLH